MSKKIPGRMINGKVSSEYGSWANMIQRCTNQNHPDYKHYGGRGITVCGRWLNSFESFLHDMGPKPTIKHSIDRFPNNESGHYEPRNCRWALQSIQNKNKRNNKRIIINTQIRLVGEWEQIMGLSQGIVALRMRRGQTIKEALLDRVSLPRVSFDVLFQ